MNQENIQRIQAVIESMDDDMRELTLNEVEQITGGDVTHAVIQ